jgi:hypothetical protein
MSGFDKRPPLHSEDDDAVANPSNPNEVPPGTNEIPSSMDELSEETRKRISGQVLDLKDDNPGVIGVNPDTGRQIVEIKKQSDSPFRPGQQSEVEQRVKDDVSFEEILKHVKQVTDYRAMTLPSKGKLYPKDKPYSEGTVMIRPMRSQEEEIILSASLLKSGEAIEQILRRCVMVGGVELRDTLELLTQDRTAILIFMRGLTMGSVYEAAFTCPHCGHAFEMNIDLDSDLDVSYCEGEVVEPMMTVLPHSGIKVWYRLPRGADERAIMQHIEERNKKQGVKSVEDALFFKISRLVTGIQGCASQNQMTQVLKMLSTKDTNHLRGLLDYPPFGVDTSVTVGCPKCGNESKTFLPMSIDFFSPRPATRTTSE